jgi:hypothetical protein
MTFRGSGTTRSGGGFDAYTIEAVWRKGRIVENNDPNVFRKDACGMWMRRSDYGKTTEYGWEIDHIQPVARGGGDELSNLQPLQWENNRHKADNWPHWSCKVAA